MNAPLPQTKRNVHSLSDEVDYPVVQDQVQLKLRIGRANELQCLGHNCLAEAVRRGDADCSVEGLLVVRNFGDRLLYVMQDFFTALIEIQTLGRATESSCTPEQQATAEKSLESLDAFARRWLSNIEVSGCPGDASALDHPDVNAHRFQQVHETGSFIFRLRPVNGGDKLVTRMIAT
jgi:hypothetical protein